MVNKTLIILCALTVSIGSNQIAISQTTVNPDISFIGDSRAIIENSLPAEIGEDGLRMEFDELEIAATGYLNPYSRADVFLGIHGTEGIEIEEASATLLRGLPLNLQIEAGQYLVDFGKINTQHDHQWSWMGRPLMHSLYFGDDGLKDVGVNISTFRPIGNKALTVSGNLLQGDFFGGHHEHGATEPTEEEPDFDPGGSGRLSLFMPFGDFTTCEAGLSGLYGQHDPDENRWTTMGGFDLKFKWRPDMYRSLTMVAEGLIGSRDVDIDTLAGILDDHNSSFGYFASVDCQFRRRYNIGAFIDFGQEPDISEDDHSAFGLFAGFSLAEETYRIGLLLRQDDGADFDGPYQTGILQFLWSLGPHKPHIY